MRRFGGQCIGFLICAISASIAFWTMCAAILDVGGSNAIEEWYAQVIQAPDARLWVASVIQGAWLGGLLPAVRSYRHRAFGRQHWRNTAVLASYCSIGALVSIEMFEGLVAQGIVAQRFPDSVLGVLWRSTSVGAVLVGLFAPVCVGVDEIAKSLRPTPPNDEQVCPSCGYDLRGEGSIKGCPECGWKRS